MKRIGFLSDLINALRKTFGWCPEQPKIDIQLEKGFNASRGTLYLDKPYSWFILMRPLSWWLAGSFLCLALGFSNLGVLFIFVIFVTLGIINIFPFILKREILLTDKELCLRLGFSEDIIEIENIESVQYIGKRPLSGFINKFSWEFFWNWGGWNLPPFLGTAWTKIDDVETKWYIYGAKRRYLRINKKKGNSITIGVDDPMLFASNLARLIPDIGYNLIVDLKKIKAMYEQISTEKLYSELLGQQEDYAGILEMRIRGLIKKGLNRDQAIREIAEREEVLGVPVEVARTIRDKEF